MDWRRYTGPGWRSEAMALMLRLAVAVPLLVGGVKFVFPWLFGIGGYDALTTKIIEGKSAFMAPWVVEWIEGTLHLPVTPFLVAQGAMEIGIAMALIVGFMTRPHAALLALLYYSFTMAAPTAGGVRLARDTTLAILAVTVAVSGGGRFSVDARWRTDRWFGSATARERKVLRSAFGVRRDGVLVAVRLAVAVSLLAAGAFTGGLFDNPINKSVAAPLVFAIGAALLAGFAPRVLMVGVIAYLVAISVYTVVTEPNVFHGLDGIKREIGIAVAAAVYAIAGPDRWSWPRPKRLPCAEAVTLLLDYVDDSLSADQRAALEAHSADCGDCGDLIREYREIIRLGRELGSRAEDVPPDLTDCATSFLTHRPAM